MRRGWMTLLLALLAVALVTYGCADKYVTSGKISMNQRNWDKAIIDFNKALEVNPNNAQAHFYLAKAYAQKEDYPHMAEHLNKVDTLDPKLAKEVGKLRDSTWYTLASFADSIMNEVPALEKDANSSFESALEKVSVGKPDSATRYYNLAKAKLRIRDNAEAEGLFTRATEKGNAGQPNEAKLVFDSCMAAATRGVFVDAKNKFEMAILIAPAKPEPYAKAGYAWYNIGDTDSSFYFYEKAHDIAPDNIEILDNLAKMALVLNKTDMVDSLLAKLLAKDPSKIEAWVMRGNIAKDAERLDDAVKYYTTALSKKDDQCNVWFNLGVTYLQQLQKLDTLNQAFWPTVDNSEQALTKAATLCPEERSTAIPLSLVLIVKKKYGDAASRLAAYTEKYPDDCRGWDLLSRALINNGQKDEAIKADQKYKDCIKNQ